MKTYLCLIFLLLPGFCIHLTAQTARDSLQKELESHYESTNLPGFAVAILNKENILFQQGFGYADLAKKTPYTVETFQNLGSVSKTIVGLALVKAIEAGNLGMNTPINEKLPFNIKNPYFPESPILVKHLANHSSGILDSKYYGQTYVLATDPGEQANMHEGYLEFIKSHETLALGDFLKKILSKEGNWYKKKNFLKAAPGSTNEYANLNAALAAYLIELSTEVPFKTYTAEEIFKPLGMKATSWSFIESPIQSQATLYFPSGQIVPKYALNTYPDGGLVSTVSELSLFLQEILKAYDGESDYLPIEAAKRMLPGDGDESRAFWGMGKKSRNIGHRGSDPGTQTDLSFHADRKIGRIIFCNVNAEDNEELWKQYEKISKILAKYEDRL